jgi:hypothetical protein
MPDRRQKDVNWFVTGDDGRILSVDHAELAVLMDIRDELKRLNDVFHCNNFIGVPYKLERIARNTSKPRRRKRKV